MVLDFDPAIQVLAKLESVEESVEWFRNHQHPDLIFLDIHLEDDLSFVIFDKVKVNSPIIFTTAYDEYAIRAFKQKSIDYLLKPIVQDQLNQAIAKFKDWSGREPGIDLSALYDLINKKNPAYRERFSVAFGQEIRSFTTSEVAWFYSMEGETYAKLIDQQEYPVEYSLDKLTGELNPADFFRINRKYLIAHKAIRQVHVFPKSHLKLEVHPKAGEDLFVSLDKVTAFKSWLGE